MMSPPGTSRHVAAAQQFGRFRSEADIDRAALRRAQAADRNVIEIIAQYSLEQGLTPRLIKVEEICAPSALET